MNESVNGKFQPKRQDGRSSAQVVVEYIMTRAQDGLLQMGDIISHDELLTELGEQALTSAYYQAIGTATKRLQQEHGRSLKAIRGRGYKFIAGAAQLDQGRDQQGKAGRALSRSYDTVRFIDESTLDSVDQKTLVRQVAKGLAATVAVLSMQAEKIAEHDEDIARLKSARLEDQSRSKATEQELSDLRRRLEAIESQQDS